MGYKNRVEEENVHVSEALLFATMCIIGLPVDVHVKDGSVFSGVFYTASTEKDYGVVLKKAKLSKKGKSGSNVAIGSVIETLVILSSDLVQIVAKGVSLSSDGVAGKIDGDNVESERTVPTEILVGGAKKSYKPGMDKRRLNQRRRLIQNENHSGNRVPVQKAWKEQDGKKMPANRVEDAIEVEHVKRNVMNGAKTAEGPALSSRRQVQEDRSSNKLNESTQKLDFHREESADAESSTSSYAHSVDKSIEEGQAKMTSKVFTDQVVDNGIVPIKPDDQCSGRSSVTDVSSISSPVATSNETVPTQSLESNKSSKEFKLNPGAKIFSPSFANPVSATPRPAVANMTYIPSNPPMVPVAGAPHPEVGISHFTPRSAIPSKFVPYSNLVTGIGGSGSEFSQPIVGHVGNRTQPVRYAGHYHPVQASPPALMNSTSQVMVGRYGQLVYVQPVSQDMVQGAAAISPLATRPVLSTHQMPFPKHQGSQALQLCLPQPFIGNGQQQYVVPSHIPAFQPQFPINRPIPIPGSHGFFGAKFP